MRFHRSIRIAKGISINFSKKGVGLSVGPRGAKISIGPRGTYINAGIPGSGIYFRQKIGGKSQQSSQSSYQSSSSYLPHAIQLTLDAKTGKVTVYSTNNEPITDPTLLRRIKRTDTYKSSVLKLYNMFREAVEENTTSFTEIHKRTPKLFPDDYWGKELEKVLNEPPLKYHGNVFPIPEPTRATVKWEAGLLAKEAAKRVFIFKRKKFIKEFTEKKIEELLKTRKEEWEKELKKFEEEERKKKEEFERKHNEEHEKRIRILKGAIEGNKERIYEGIESFLKSLSLPFEFTANYELEGEQLKVDLDLPEIEDIETRIVNITSNGRLSIKQKSQKELRHDYARGVCGMAFFFAGNFFNISPKIKEILISGYTQRISPKTGKVNDEYIYSILFDRKTFKGLVLENIDPIAAFDNFKHRMHILKTFEMKAIEPF